MLIWGKLTVLQYRDISLMNCKYTFIYSSYCSGPTVCGLVWKLQAFPSTLFSMQSSTLVRVGYTSCSVLPSSFSAHLTQVNIFQFHSLSQVLMTLSSPSKNVQVAFLPLALINKDSTSQTFSPEQSHKHRLKRLSTTARFYVSSFNSRIHIHLSFYSTICWYLFALIQRSLKLPTIKQN